ncbi:MAG TPA: rhomboid family intramembrane serine protease [Burkholderiales bacterium]|nr:rhomboid family intramembrane serine protease [Burkholderiales bacterium]
MLNSLPPVTRALIAVNILMFVAEHLLGDNLTLRLALWPLQSAPLSDSLMSFQPWQLLTYGFLHGSLWHLFFNMFALYMFGGQLEMLWGPKRYLNLYLASVIVAGLAQLLVAGITSAAPYPTIGASGGVFGLLLAYAMYFPHRTILLLIPPIPMPAWLFVTLYGLLELYLGATGSEPGVAHFAHLGGMVGAWLLIQYWRGRPPFRRR